MRPTLRPLLLAGTALLALPGVPRAQAPDARPQGGGVVAGQASIAQTPGRTQVQQTTNRAVIEWRGFDIGANHHVDIRQPDAASFSLQRVTGPDPSAIAGRLTSNGGVAIVNPAGIVFHQGAQVDVAALIATASDATNQNFMAGRMAFDGTPRPGARVENRGTITVRDQGLAALVGPVAANSGTIRARMGRVAIAGAEAVTIDLAGDGLLSFDVTRQVAGGALAANTGSIEAAGGHVLLTAQGASAIVESMVEAGGTIAARTIAANAPGGAVRVPDGAVLDASAPTGGGRVTIGAAPASTIRAPRDLAARTTVERGATIQAEATQAGPGGTVIVHSSRRTVMSGGIAARGAGGGAGGQVEVSSRGTIRLDGHMRVGRTGRVLVDPEEVRIVDTPADGSEIAASTVNDTEGLFVVEAERSIRVLATVDRSVGPLTLQTTNESAAPGDGISIEAPLSMLGDLRLRTAGDIGQTDGARVAAGTLFAESRGGTVRLDAFDNLITALDGGRAADLFLVTTATRLAVDATVAAGTIRLTSAEGINLRAPLSAGLVVLAANGAEGVAQAASGAGIAATQLRVEAPLGAVALAGAGNAVATLGDSQAGAGITLRNAGALEVAGNVNASGTALRLTLDAGDLTQQDGTRIVAESLALELPGGGARLDQAGNAVQRVGGRARDGIALRTATALTLDGSGLDAPVVTLDATGDIAQETDALLVAGSLRARSDEGAVLLQDPLNRIGSLGDSGAATQLLLATEGTLRVTGTVAAPTVALTAGAIVQEGGAIRATGLRATALTGAVALDGAGNAVERLGDSGAATGFTLTTDSALRVEGDVTAGGVVRLSAGALTLGGGIGGSGATFVATGGDIAQSAGAITAPTLRAEASGEVRLDAATNAVATVSGRAGPLFRLRVNGALAPDDIAAEAVALTAGGAITQDVAGLGIATALFSAEAGGAVRLRAAANAIAALGGVTAPDGLVLRNGGALELTAPLALRSAELVLGGDLSQRPDAPISAGTLRLGVTGSVLLEDAGNALPRLLDAAATGDLRIATAGPLALAGEVSAGATLRLQAGDAITQPAGRILAPVLLASSTGGGVTLDRPGNAVGAAAGAAAGTWRLTGGGTGDLGLAGLIAAPEVALTLAGGLAQGSGALRTDALALAVAGGVALDGPGHRVAALAGQAGAIRLDAGGPLDVTGPLAAGAELAISADRIGLLAPASAGRALLVALGGDVTQRASGAALTVAGPLEAHASGAVTLDGAGNQIVRLAGGSAGGGFALATTGALTAGGTIAGETVVLRAGGVLTLDGAAFAAGRAVLVAAPAGIATGAASALAPLDPARLPVLILDTRAAGLVAIPDAVLPDVPGLAPAAQPTQLGTFGPAANLPAGSLAFEVAAGGSPVFLLLDAGPALGAMEAGRLGVLGLGGGAFLVGALGGVGGEAAAALAVIAGAPESYRFNTCPMGLANCGAPPPEPPGPPEPPLPPDPGDPGPPPVLPPLVPAALPPPLLVQLTDLLQPPGGAPNPDGPSPWSGWPATWPPPPVAEER